MIRPPLKTVRVESQNFPDGVLINAENFNPDYNVLWGKIKPKPEAKPTEAEAKADAKQPGQ